MAGHSRFLHRLLRDVWAASRVLAQYKRTSGGVRDIVLTLWPVIYNVPAKGVVRRSKFASWWIMLSL